MLALRAAKHFLCEEAFTVNGVKAKLGRDSEDVILMEAMGATYFPI
jgi:hypothetical protein